MEYKYYSTQRPVDIGTFPKPPGNPPLAITNYDERIWIEDELLLAWGELTYAMPLTQAQLDDYELKASRHNPNRARRYPLDAMAETFEVVHLLNRPALFTELRVDRATIPKGLYAYDMQVADDDWSRPCLLGRYISVEHFGTVLTAAPIKLNDEGYRDLSPEDFTMGTGAGRMTTLEFKAACRCMTPEPHPKRSSPQRGER